jgi:hypothetical protein
MLAMRRVKVTDVLPGDTWIANDGLVTVVYNNSPHKEGCRLQVMTILDGVVRQAEIRHPIDAHFLIIRPAEV